MFRSLLPMFFRPAVRNDSALRTIAAALAQGREVDTGELVDALAKSGRTMADLERMVEQHDRFGGMGGCPVMA